MSKLLYKAMYLVRIYIEANSESLFKREQGKRNPAVTVINIGVRNAACIDNRNENCEQ